MYEARLILATLNGTVVDQPKIGNFKRCDWQLPMTLLAMLFRQECEGCLDGIVAGAA
jgi:hypothetical protein